MVLRHLIVLTHGLGAMPFYMNGISDVLHAKFGALREDADAGKLAGADDAAPTMVALRVRNTSGIGETLDGIDMAGRRVFAEVQAFCERHPTIDRISFVGHSMGGIINRYTVGVAESAGFFDKVEPVAFISLASPHLGSRRPRTNVFDSLVNFVGATLNTRRLSVNEATGVTGTFMPDLLRALDKNASLESISLPTHRNIKTDDVFAIMTSNYQAVDAVISAPYQPTVADIERALDAAPTTQPRVAAVAAIIVIEALAVGHCVDTSAPVPGIDEATRLVNRVAQMLTDDDDGDAADVLRDALRKTQ